MRRYPAYRDSGVEWLGEVPAGWGVVPLKYLVSFASGGTPSKDNLDFWEGAIPWASAKDLKVEDLWDTELHITDHAVDSGAANLVLKGAVIVLVRGMTLAKAFPVCLARVPIAINQDLKALLPADRLRPEFLAWVLRGLEEESLGRVDEAGHGTKALRMDAWAGMEIVVPPLPEQQAIAAFLDRETAKIDALVAEQRRLVELLREKRQAVISHAVTRGLDPTARLKPSGVDWLGEVPEGWEVVPLNKVAQVQTGIAKGKDFEGVETISVPYLRVANVQDGFLDLEDVTMIEIPPDLLERYRLRPGDVLMNEGGDFDKLGRGAIWAGQVEDCIHQNHVFAVRPAKVEPEWLNLLTSSSYAQFFFMSRSKQSTNLASISSTNLMMLPVSLPPEGERHAILQHVAREIDRLSALSREAETAIALLQERRAALISAAVTGQIDVREAVASPETEAA